MKPSQLLIGGLFLTPAIYGLFLIIFTKQILVPVGIFAFYLTVSLYLQHVKLKEQFDKEDEELQARISILRKMEAYIHEGGPKPTQDEMNLVAPLLADIVQKISVKVSQKMEETFGVA